MQENFLSHQHDSQPATISSSHSSQDITNFLFHARKYFVPSARSTTYNKQLFSPFIGYHKFSLSCKKIFCPIGKIHNLQQAALLTSHRISQIFSFMQENFFVPSARFTTCNKQFFSPLIGYHKLSLSCKKIFCPISKIHNLQQAALLTSHRIPQIFSFMQENFFVPSASFTTCNKQFFSPFIGYHKFSLPCKKIFLSHQRASQPATSSSSHFS
jgi:hypothetical protein